MFVSVSSAKAFKLNMPFTLRQFKHTLFFLRSVLFVNERQQSTAQVSFENKQPEHFAKLD
jgi:hypothetical protein